MTISRAARAALFGAFAFALAACGTLSAPDAGPPAAIAGPGQSAESGITTAGPNTVAAAESGAMAAPGARPADGRSEPSAAASSAPAQVPVTVETIVAQTSRRDSAPIALSTNELPRPQAAFAHRPVGNLWDRIRRGFAMPALDSPLVAAHERAYLAQPEYLERMVERSRKYLYHIVEEVEKRKLPTELALLPFVESAMDPEATSHAKAAGLWQFMPSTGRAFDLKQNWWVDNRRDVVQSTRAALDYLEKIYALNDNDWFLALASYNWGEGAVARARKANRRAGRDDGYLALRMPRETRNYVPKLIALKNLIARADDLGLALPYLADQPYFVTIDQLRPIDLKLAARFAGMSIDEFVALNPAHNRPVISASRTRSIKLPADRLHGFLAAVDRHESQNRVFASWQPYTLQKGENLIHVARRFGTTVDELRKANGLSRRGRLIAGSRILAPHKQVADESRVETFRGTKLVEQIESPARYYAPRRNESVKQIARRFRVSTDNLRAWNRLSAKTSTVRAGTRLLVRPSSESTVVTDEAGSRRVIRSRVAQPKSPAVAADTPSPKSSGPTKLVKSLKIRTTLPRAKRATAPRM